MGNPADAAQQPSVTCKACVGSGDCGSNASCVQYGGSDYCGHECSSPADCAPGETCTPSVSSEGHQVSVCVPVTGSCGGTTCGTCPGGYTCDEVTGTCQPAGGSADAGVCPGYDPPDTASCCHSCTPGTGNCAANGCYGGWWCDRSACRCHAPLGSCGGTIVDAGPTPDGAMPTGSVGPGGGSVSRLYFAVVGDTRPSVVDDTAGYPTAIITKIYQDVQGLNPRPEFVVTTGDYVFAKPAGVQAAPQLAEYVGARNAFSGTVFAVLGNHECDGYTVGNCTGAAAASSANYQQFMTRLITPLGKSAPYYTIPINDTAGHWTAKLVVVACNAWDTTQKDWLAAELAKPTTYTFITRHEPLGANAPCNADMDAMLSTATYNLLIVGHTHTYSHSGKQLIEGVGGAPITSSANYGFATVEQLPAGGFQVTQYDYQTVQPVSTFTVP